MARARAATHPTGATQRFEENETILIVCAVVESSPSKHLLSPNSAQTVDIPSCTLPSLVAAQTQERMASLFPGRKGT